MSMIAAVAIDGLVRILSVETCTVTRTYDPGQRCLVCCWSSDGLSIACGCESGTVMLMTAVDGAIKWSANAHSGWVKGVCFTDDGMSLCSCSYDGTVVTMSGNSGAELEVVQAHSGWVMNCAASKESEGICS